MLDFERRVVASLISSGDPALRADVEAFVDGSLGAMPEHLRAGVAVESIVLGAYARIRSLDTARLIEAFDRSPLAPVRQYVRLLRSLVLFAEQELAPAPAASAAST